MNAVLNVTASRCERQIVVRLRAISTRTLVLPISPLLYNQELY